MNPRLTPKDLRLIKGALRRVFARSELRNSIVNSTLLEGYSDPKRKRVKNWCRCPVCKKPEARSYMQADHVEPVVPLDKTIDDLSVAELVDRLWCEERLLKPICKFCHKIKTNAENKIRRENKKKKEKQNEKDAGSFGLEKCNATTKAGRRKVRTVDA